MEYEPWRYNAYLKRLIQRVDAGGLKPIHMRTFDGFANGVPAMQYLQRAQNIGKVIISAPSRMKCTPDSTHVLSGGTGALGIVAAQFLVEEGSHSLCLLSRSGQVPADLKTRWKWLQDSVANVSIHRCDVAKESDVLTLKDSLQTPLAGLLHLAGALADGMLPSLTEDMIRKSYQPKVHGLHNLCKLPFSSDAAFLLFSSTSSLFGSPGQANYSASNSVLDALAPHWVAQGIRQAKSIQWGPWAEVGMAVEKGTVARAKASGLGALTNAQGMAIMGSVLHGGDHVVCAAHVRWGKFLRTLYDEPPAFLENLEAEARRAAPAGEDDGGGGLDFSGLSPEQRTVAVRDLVLSVAKEVVNSDDLDPDAALLESGMDSLSGVEFRNRLLKGFNGVKIPNSAVFDYPTANALASFIDAQLGSTPSTSQTQITTRQEGAPPAQQMLEQLNDRDAGIPLFLVPGAGLQAGGFQALAQLLPVPTYSVSWPKGTLQRSSWPTTVPELAALLVTEVRKARPSGPYQLAGHSFGACVCLEMARLLEADGEKVVLVALLDPRSLPPIETSVKGAFGSAGIADTLALLSQTMVDGSRYAGYCEELSQLNVAEHTEAARRILGSAAYETLEHVHETSQWFASLLADFSPNSPKKKKNSKLKARLTWLAAEETWKQEPKQSENRAETIVRTYQSTVFQSNDDVARNAANLSGGEKIKSISVPGGHFAMLHAPHVTTTALQLCHALVESVAADA